MNSRWYEFEVEIRLAFQGVSPSVKYFELKIPKANTILERGERDSIQILPRNNLISYRSDAMSWDAPLVDHWTYLESRFNDKQDALVELSKACSKTVCSIIVTSCSRFVDVAFPGKMLDFLNLIDAYVEIVLRKDTSTDED